MSRLTLLVLAIAATGCAGRYTILTVPAISMTKTTFEAGYKPTPGPHVSAQYCSGDKPVVSQDDNVGLIDEAVMKAQQQSGATYIADAVISRQDDCVIVEGTAMK
jgi:hypothetical protein